jgi:DNA-binding NtrC family response regulator
MTRILIVDDDPSIASLLEALAGRMGFDTETTLSSEQAAEFIRREHYDLIMTDLMMPGFNGLELAEMALKLDPEIMVILITGHASLNTALSALRLGIYDYILKPFKLEKVEHTIHSALEKKALKAENRTLKTELSGKKENWDIIGKSESLERVFHIIRKAAPTQTTILISGESGTGKELVAKAIHRHSDRKHQPFISVNCGAIPENLLESDLFGFKKGSFTDAKADHIGRFIQANHGTLFLDEIGTMPRNLQVKLLRAIQEREIRPLGSSRSRKIDVRIIAASNADLRDMIKTGEFREDLYYRLNVIPIHVPPLRDRKNDIPLLIKHFIEKHGPVLNMKDARFAPETLTLLQNYHWPGNVRQLENVVECSLALATDDQMIGVEDLPQELKDVPALSTPRETTRDSGKTMEDLVSEYERHLIREALKHSGGVKTRAARELKIKRTTLIEKMKRLNISSDTGKEKR